jgi:predicted ATPase
MPSHQQSMRSMLDWSFGLLTKEEQDFFCRLAKFSESFTMDEARALVTIQNIDAKLTALIDHSLLEQTSSPDQEPRFKMMGIVREYAIEQGRAGCIP